MTNSLGEPILPTRCCCVLQPSALPNLVLDTKLRGANDRIRQEICPNCRFRTDFGALDMRKRAIPKKVNGIGRDRPRSVLPVAVLGTLPNARAMKRNLPPVDYAVIRGAPYRMTSLLDFSVVSAVLRRIFVFVDTIFDSARSRSRTRKQADI